MGTKNEKTEERGGPPSGRADLVSQLGDIAARVAELVEAGHKPSGPPPPPNEKPARPSRSPGQAIFIIVALLGVAALLLFRGAQGLDRYLDAARGAAPAVGSFRAYALQSGTAVHAMLMGVRIILTIALSMALLQLAASVLELVIYLLNKYGIPAATLEDLRSRVLGAKVKAEEHSDGKRAALLGFAHVAMAHPGLLLGSLLGITTSTVTIVVPATPHGGSGQVAAMGPYLQSIDGRLATISVTLKDIDGKNTLPAQTLQSMVQSLSIDLHTLNVRMSDIDNRTQDSNTTLKRIDNRVTALRIDARTIINHLPSPGVKPPVTDFQPVLARLAEIDTRWTREMADTTALLDRVDSAVKAPNGSAEPLAAEMYRLMTYEDILTKRTSRLLAHKQLETTLHEPLSKLSYSVAAP